MESHIASDRDLAPSAFRKLLDIMAELREKCPWDQQQTMGSLRSLTIEEVFELSDAILEDDMGEIKKELGDLLAHIVLYAIIATEQRAFTITDVIQTLCEKLIYRHPHIYGKKTAKNIQAAAHNWEQQKLKEKGNRSVLGGVPRTLPSLIKAMRIQEKTSRIGFDWPGRKAAWQEVQEKIQVLTQYSGQSGPKPMQKETPQEEFGGLLFSLVNYARLEGINPEEALEKANKKFTKKIQCIEQKVTREGNQIAQLATEELMRYWQEAE